MPLTDIRIRALKPGDKPTKHGDGGGLLLVVNPNGSKLWRMVYRYCGKQKQLAFGAWPDVSLAQARAHRDAARKLLADDIDGFQTMKQARSPWPRLQRPINARNHRSGFALICTPGKLALQEETIMEINHDHGEEIRNFISQQGSGMSNFSNIINCSSIGIATYIISE